MTRKLVLWPQPPKLFEHYSKDTAQEKIYKKIINITKFTFLHYFRLIL